MKVKVMIKIIDATKSGVSRSTGNPWKTKGCVVEMTEDDGGKSTIACSTWNHDVINQMDKLEVGDVVVMDIRMNATARTFKYRDGSDGVERGNEAKIFGIEDAPL